MNSMGKVIALVVSESFLTLSNSAMVKLEVSECTARGKALLPFCTSGKVKLPNLNLPGMGED